MNNEPKVIWVNDNITFAALADKWLNATLLAIDTEFERRTTYYPILALVQVFDGENVYLIDPLKVQCPDSFRVICKDQSIIKLMHSAREDLEVFYYSWGCEIKGLFDTQIANAFISGEMSKGYAGLVETICNVTLDKQATQSNWMIRPLTDKQLDYAAKDVLYLPGIYEQLNKLLIDKTFNHLFKLECNELCLLAIKSPDYQKDYREAKDVWRLNKKQLSLFKLLYRWREETAIKDDRTKNHILRDPQLVQVAILQPKSKTALQKIEDFHPRAFRLYSQDIIDIINQFENRSTVEEKSLVNPRDVNQLNLLSDQLLKVVKQQANRLEVAPGLLASKRIIKKIAYAKLTNETYPDIWYGWRGDILRAEFNILCTQLSL
jgi:ribonuclease D